MSTTTRPTLADGTPLRSGMTVLRVDRSGMRPSAAKYRITFALGSTVRGDRLTASGAVASHDTLTTGFMVTYKLAG